MSSWSARRILTRTRRHAAAGRSGCTGVDGLAVLGEVALSGALVVISFAVPVIVIVGLLWLARRRYAGRRGRFDRVFEGIGRANAMNSRLNAGTPDPDDLAVPHLEALPRR